VDIQATARMRHESGSRTVPQHLRSDAAPNPAQRADSLPFKRLPLRFCPVVSSADDADPKRTDGTSRDMETECSGMVKEDSRFRSSALLLVGVCRFRSSCWGRRTRGGRQNRRACARRISRCGDGATVCSLPRCGPPGSAAAVAREPHCSCRPWPLLRCSAHCPPRRRQGGAVGDTPRRMDERTDDRTDDGGGLGAPFLLLSSSGILPLSSVPCSPLLALSRPPAVSFLSQRNGAFPFLAFPFGWAAAPRPVSGAPRCWWRRFDGGKEGGTEEERNTRQTKDNEAHEAHCEGIGTEGEALAGWTDPDRGAGSVTKRRDWFVTAVRSSPSAAGAEPTTAANTRDTGHHSGWAEEGKPQRQEGPSRPLCAH
jgi:hypothetical protein